MRLALLALTAAATLAVPALSSPASATCWFDCKPFPLPVPQEPSPESTSVTGPAYSEATCGDSSFASTAAAPIPSPIEEEYCWACCSPPGGPVCCTYGGGPSICYGDGPDFPEPVNATFVDPQTEACLAEAGVPALDGEPLECRADDLTPSVATLFVQLLSWLA